MTVFVVTACAGQPAYRAAEPWWLWLFRNVKLRKSNTGVNFKARGDNIGMAVDYAMTSAL